ncbi:S-4TM family putative pore-forming effector [Anabaena sp. PCC 7108]|uniref:S-4TM family putative pore-forming effector n=1 Tax=Anabaena sp. PCC 7108 TaxID=163908 RepID=UPI00034788C1|nr:S-4TM family putative pore-forming effector [Anabaena sp. PCC 7108]
MAQTVNVAFDEFLKDYVNLDIKDTAKARNSRDWLIEEQIHSFPYKDLYFPRFYSEKDIYFGSFARRTKKRPLDDIDIMIALSAEGSTYYEYTNGVIEMYVPDSAYKLKMLCNDDTNTLNSRKILNKFKYLLSKVPQYQEADIKTNLEAVTLKLKSYTWNFDIVPCFFTNPELSGRTYYLIPDGKGNWKKTDPRIDRYRVTEVNQAHNGNVLNVIRLMKFWNKRQTMPSMGSWQQVINRRIPSQELERESYILQNQIYDNRRLSPLIFDWLYSRLKKQNEEQMNKGAEVLIKELLQTP